MPPKPSRLRELTEKDVHYAVWGSLSSWFPASRNAMLEGHPHELTAPLGDGLRCRNEYVNLIDYGRDGRDE